MGATEEAVDEFEPENVGRYVSAGQQKSKDRVTHVTVARYVMVRPCGHVPDE